MLLAVTIIWSARPQSSDARDRRNHRSSDLKVLPYCECEDKTVVSSVIRHLQQATLRQGLSHLPFGSTHRFKERVANEFVELPASPRLSRADRMITWCCFFAAVLEAASLSPPAFATRTI